MTEPQPALVTPGTGMAWLPVLTTDARARALVRRHYSAWKNPHPLGPRFVGPGEASVFLTPACDAVFVWRLSRYRQDGQVGLECSIFRNEGTLLSSDLIREADELADERWGAMRHFTYVDPRQTKGLNPGYCFLMAGWQRVRGRRSSRGFHLLERPL